MKSQSDFSDPPRGLFKKTDTNSKSHANRLMNTGHHPLKRRDIIKKLALLPFFGPFIGSVLHAKGWESYEERNLKDKLSEFNHTNGGTSTGRLNGNIPKAKIAGVEFSRMILGGNLIGGWAHARDLIYVSKLVTTYFTDDKIFETFALAEKMGINAFLTNPVLCRVINEYWKRDLGKIKFISDGGFNWKEGIPQSIDNGASACYVHGGVADNLAESGKVEEIGKAVELIRQNKIPAGIGAHKLATVKACVEKGIVPDFWMKTLHRTDYWSANKENQNDNIWCTDPDDTIQFMKDLKQPWIAYKILAAGAIDPQVGIRYAFENGADFICLGMFDFQLEEDVAITSGLLNSKISRERPWRA